VLTEPVNSHCGGPEAEATVRCGRAKTDPAGDVGSFFLCGLSLSAALGKRGTYEIAAALESLHAIDKKKFSM
jgi:hypothetical protein